MRDLNAPKLSMMKSGEGKISRFFGHPLVVTLIGTGLISLVGAVLTFNYQKQLLTIEYKLEMFRAEIADVYQIADELNKIMSERLFNLNRVVWGVEDAGAEKFNEIWDEYYANVRRWSSNLLYYKIRLQRIEKNQEIVEMLLNEKDYLDEGTVHGAFLKAHNLARELRKCYRNGCPERKKRSLLKATKAASLASGFKIEEFGKSLSETIRQRKPPC